MGHVRINGEDGVGCAHRVTVTDFGEAGAAKPRRGGGDTGVG